MDKKTLDRVIKRFTKDYNVPINIYDPDIFDYYTKLYDFFPRDIYKNLLETIEKDYNGDVDAWINYCAGVRDKAINFIKEQPEYQELLKSQRYALNTVSLGVGERSCYTHENNGKRFISIDLKKANFQAMKAYGFIKEDTYEDFIKSFGGDDYIANSKYLRQVIFGNLNPLRQVNKEKELISNAYHLVEDMLTHDKSGADVASIYSFNSDEIVLMVYPNYKDDEYIKETIKAAEEKIKNELGTIVKIEYVEIEDLKILNYKDDSVEAYVRKNLITGEEKLKKASTTFYPQIYKIWKGQKITDADKLFYFEGQVCSFINELKQDTSITFDDEG